ncbi:MAG: nitrogen fixation protein NifQ [Rhodospirillaceae bacterium]|nr:nitrogen fixation protein NifQ [Rhodospirillales bacterium]
MSETYHRLMACAGAADPFDAHVFACILAKGQSEAPRPLTEAVGLAGPELARLVARLFPGAQWLPADWTASSGADAIEEPDLRAMLTDNATIAGSDEAAWLAAMVARRSLQPDHLWQDLGLSMRSDLNGLLNRHFAPLAALNTQDMKWKKFFYRQMCQIEGINICKSPACDTCTDYPMCYGPEE